MGFDYAELERSPWLLGGRRNARDFLNQQGQYTGTKTFDEATSLMTTFNWPRNFESFPQRNMVLYVHSEGCIDFMFKTAREIEGYDESRSLRPYEVGVNLIEFLEKARINPRVCGLIAMDRPSLIALNQNDNFAREPARIGIGVDRKLFATI